MNVVILGAGVVGISTAYFLAEKGYQVTLVDQHPQPGCGSSYANGGQLSYNYSTPIATPQTLKQLPKIALGFDPAFKIYPSLDLNFYKWTLRYLRQCLPAKSNQSAGLMKQLGLLAQAQLADIVDKTHIDFDLRKQAGKLYLYQDKSYSSLKSSNDEFTLACTKEDVFSRVPGLNPATNVSAGLLDFKEDAGDSHRFCLALNNYLKQKHSNFTFLAEHKILSASTEAGNISVIETDKGKVSGDHYILSMGPQSALFARSLGIKLPIYPMKGYSVTVPATDLCPTLSVTDTANKMVYCRLGDRLRIAGFAEFSGYDTRVKQKRIDSLLKKAKQLMPEAGEYHHIIDQWCGLRPATPDSLPIVSQSPYKNLLLNTGHGMLGWTYSTATADLACHLLLNRAHSHFDINALHLNRFD